MGHSGVPGRNLARPGGKPNSPRDPRRRRRATRCGRAARGAETACYRLPTRHPRPVAPSGLGSRAETLWARRRLPPLAQRRPSRPYSRKRAGHRVNHDRYTDQYIAGILAEARTIAMVGASAVTNRPSYFAMKYLIGKGYAVIPVNPNLADGE